MREIQAECYYTGEFAPPTKDHFDTAKMLETRPGVTRVIVVIGNDNSDVLSQKDKFEIWQTYLKSEMCPRISLEMTEDKSSLAHLISLLDKKPNKNAFVAIDENNGKSENFNRIFNKYPGVEYQLIPSQFRKESQEFIRSAKEDDDVKFKNILPINIDDSTAKNIKSMFKKEEDEPVDEQSPSIKEYVLNKMDNFWKKILN